MKELNSILLVWCLTGIVLCSGAALYFWRFEKKHPEVKLADGNPDIKRKYHSAVMLVFGFIFALILGLICVLAYLTGQTFLWIPATVPLGCLCFCLLAAKRKNFKNNFLRHPKTVPFILFPYLYFGIQTILQSLKNENMHD